jgi:hypothetical protein
MLLVAIAEVDARTSFATGLPSYNNYRALWVLDIQLVVDNIEVDIMLAVLSLISTTWLQTLLQQELKTQEQHCAQETCRNIPERYVYFMRTYESFQMILRASNNAAQISLKPGCWSPQGYYIS